MNVFLFMLKKAIRPTVLLTVGLVCIAAIFICSSFYSTYPDNELYTQLFEELPQGQEGYEFARHSSERLSDETTQVLKDAEKYINEHRHGSIPPVLPKDMTERVFEARFGTDKSTGGSQVQSAYSLIADTLYSQINSYDLISRRTEGYSRNIRRGVTDEYSLKTAEKLTADYEKVMEREAGETARYDTRWADHFVKYLSSEAITYIGIFILLFSSFSAELQSGRFKAFKLTSAGALRYSSYRLLCGVLQTAFFFTIYYIVLSSITVLMSGSKILSMPVQYLGGFELSHLPMSFGKFLLYMYLIKLTFLLMLSAAVMLLSLMSSRVIVSALICLLPLSVPFAAKHLPLSDTAKQIISCDIISMNNDTDLVDIGGSPYGIVGSFFVITLFSAVIFAVITLFLSGRRNCNV